MENKPMNCYLIESLAPLVFRSGKPFGSQASAQDVIFPLPSAGAGLIRSLSIAQGNTVFDKTECKLNDSDYQKLLAIKSYGIYLAKYQDGTDTDITILVPKPANTLYVEDDGKIVLYRLAPKALDGECGSDLPEGLYHVQTVDKDGNTITIKGKPKSGVNYWSLADVIRWQQDENLTYEEVKENGVASIPTEIRTHVAIDESKHAAEDGKLFQTASYDLGCQFDSDKKRFDEERLGFVVFSGETLGEDLATLGGERRLSKLKPTNGNLFPIADETAVNAINQAGGFSLGFLTPCIFAQGYLPAWIDKDSKEGTLPDSNIKVRLRAVAIERWQAVSGWDSLLWKPKAMRKAVSAGSVYWFELIDKMDLPTLQRLQQSLADDGYDQNDGFGMALVSPYSTSQ